jgi:N-acetyl-gamma-glutamyl-phosphate reductase
VAVKRPRAAIVGVTGYAGSELARLLARHPGVELQQASARSAAGKPISAVHPHLLDVDLEVGEAVLGADVAFVALPAQASSPVVHDLVAAGTRVIDVGSDFRLKDPAAYPRWYKFTHPHPGLLAQAVYGLTELVRSHLPRAPLIACPGCYPTAAILGLAPAVSAGLIGGPVVVDAKSGVSGAGKKVDAAYLFAELNENCYPYGLNGHRHTPEMEQALNLQVTFTPHLVPMTRGILATCYAPLARSTSAAEVQDLYQEFYRAAPFVRATPHIPQTKQTLGSNYCLVHPLLNERTNTLVVIAALDNLVKGGAGQAVQNFNLAFGLPETLGLDQLPLYP